MEEEQIFYYDKKNNIVHCKIPLLNGKQHGIVKYWYPTGELCSEYTYEHGDRKGVIKSYLINGGINVLLTNYTDAFNGPTVKFKY